MIVMLNGHTFEKYVEMLDVTSLSRPDPSWVFKDIWGHEHRWYDEGQPMFTYSPSKQYNLSTCRYVLDDKYWCSDCQDEHQNGHWECRVCGAHVTPGTVADDTRQFVPGLKTYRVDEKCVSPEEYFRLWKEYGGDAFHS